MAHPAARGMRSTLVGILTNALLAVIKGTAGVLGNSYALIADAIESTTDIASSLIVWVGLKISGKPPDADHPYGHGKAEPIAAVVVALALLGAAIGIAAQSVDEILTPHSSPAPFTLLVLLLVVVTKEALFRFVFTVGTEIRSTAVKSDAWHHRSDAITSAAAFVGISISLIGGPGFDSADDWAALFASAIIAMNAYRILRPALNEVMDAAPPSSLVDAVLAAASTVADVASVEKCRVRKVGFAHYVDLHVEVHAGLTVQHGHTIAHAVKSAVLAQVPQVSDVLVHVEPAPARPPIAQGPGDSVQRRDFEPSRHSDERARPRRAPPAPPEDARQGVQHQSVRRGVDAVRSGLPDLRDRQESPACGLRSRRPRSGPPGTSVPTSLAAGLSLRRRSCSDDPA